MITSRGTIAALALLAIAACSRVTPENYSKLETGMTRDEVHALLGKPDDVSGGAIGRMTLMTERWNGSGHSISVTYAGDQLTIKRIDPRER